jgi:hypothetical protein
MKTFKLIILMIVLAFKGISQQDTTDNISLLRGPISPASSLLGINANDIQRPTDVKAFMISLQNSTQNLSSLPSSFAVDIAPYWFGKKGLSLYEATKNDKNLLKSLVLSIAARNLQSSKKTDSTSQIGIGFRMALARGKYQRREIKNMNSAFETYVTAFEKQESSNEEIETLKAKRDSLGKLFNDAFRSDPTLFKKIKKEADEIDKILSENLSGEITGKKLLAEQNKAKSIDEIKKFKSLKIARTGFKADLAGGVAWDFKESKYLNGKIQNAGIWLTAGNEGEKGHTILGIIRYLYKPDQLYRDIEGLLKTKTTGVIDAGLRYNYQMPDSPFNLSIETIYRSPFSNEFNASWKSVFNTSYDVGQNTILTFSLGRDFDKTIKKDGNIIAMLNFVKGFGSN